MSIDNLKNHNALELALIINACRAGGNKELLERAQQALQEQEKQKEQKKEEN